jgi:hypothetical protein
VLDREAGLLAVRRRKTVIRTINRGHNANNGAARGPPPAAESPSTTCSKALAPFFLNHLVEAREYVAIEKEAVPSAQHPATRDRVADIHVSQLSRENRILPTRATEERAKANNREDCD